MSIMHIGRTHTESQQGRGSENSDRFRALLNMPDKYK
jgi:hypothetical protein